MTWDGEAQAAQPLRPGDPAAGPDQDDLALLDPGEADQPGRLAARTGPQGGDVAALAEQAGERVGEVVVGGDLRRGVLEGADRDAVGGELLGQPALVGGDAGGGGDGAAGEPEGVRGVAGHGGAFLE